MGVKVKKEDRIRRVAEQRREKIRRFPDAYKARHGGKIIHEVSEIGLLKMGTVVRFWCVSPEVVAHLAG